MSWVAVDVATSKKKKICLTLPSFSDESMSRHGDMLL